MNDDADNTDNSAIWQHVVTESGGGCRLDRYAADSCDLLASRKAAYKAAKGGRLQVDGDLAPPHLRLLPGMRIALHEDLSIREPVLELTLAVHVEDEHLAVVEKPAGIPVSGNYPRTVQRALPYNLDTSALPDCLPFPRPVHRLDAPTGGLVLIAKTATAMVALSRQFQQRAVGKAYVAVVTGRLEGAGTIDAPLDGRSAITHYGAMRHMRSLHTDWLTEVRLTPVTGRTHQLRRHLADVGHPIAGDTHYGKSGHVYRGKGLFLWAVHLRFTHPETAQKVDVSIPPPPKFRAYLEREGRRWHRTHGDGPGADSQHDSQHPHRRNAAENP